MSLWDEKEPSERGNHNAGLLQIREHFAAMALQGLLANPHSAAPIIFYQPLEAADGKIFERREPSIISSAGAEIAKPATEGFAELAVRYADALLEALEKSQ